MRKIFSALALSLLCFNPAHADGENHGIRWEFYKKLAQNQPKLPIGANKHTLVKNEKLTLGIKVPETGYLNIFAIDINDKVTVLFPNQYHTHNKVNAGTFAFPTRKMKFELVTNAPFGNTLVVAVLSHNYLNLHNEQQKHDKSMTRNQAIFRELSEPEAEQLAKSFSVAPKQTETKPATSDIRIGVQELLTCENAENCDSL